MFITFEGIEGSGKSTQAALLADALAREGRPVVRTHEPGGTALGREIRRLLLGPETALAPLAELFLVLADRAEHVARTLRPALARGAIVVCDRFADSTLAYQGFGRGLDPALLRRLEGAAREELSPDRTFLLDCPVALGLDRSRARGAGPADRFEGEGAAFHERVRQGFLAIAREEPGRVVVLDGTRSAQALHEEIRAAFEAGPASPAGARPGRPGAG